LNSISIAVVIPVFNEDGAGLSQTLVSASGADEIIVVDGGSDASRLQSLRKACAAFDAELVFAPRGRASQMNAGAKLAKSVWLIFLHADVQLPSDWRQRLIAHLEQKSATSLPEWGRFNVRFRQVYAASAKHNVWVAGMWIVGTFMNIRSRFSRISTGDQAQFIRQSSFIAMNGFSEQLLMEDIEFSRRAVRMFGNPLNLSCCVTVSARRWYQFGYFRTIALMWKLRWQYWRGAKPAELHKAYYGEH
jgi:rSAM/selenodomain-associated transferase 2